MSDIGKKQPKEYSDRFDELRQNRVATSYYKYGTAADNFGMGLVNALDSHNLCIKKYLATGNTEYLCDAANYLMFEFMYPQKEGAKYQPTDGTNLGKRTTVGISVNEMKDIKEGNGDRWLRYY